MRALMGMTGIVLISLVCLGSPRGPRIELAAMAGPDSAQEADEQPRRPASSHAIAAATADFQEAVNGRASVRNRCTQGKEIEIEETTEVVERDRCKIVLKTTKTTHDKDSPKDSADSRQTIEFTINADLSALTTPVLVETQRFAQCDAGGSAVLKVSSRSDPKQPIRVVRRSPPATKEDGIKQTRRDLSLFFVDPKAAKRAADALERAVKACGGKEWPDEDDLP